MARPPLCSTSREMVDGARPSCTAISLSVSPSAIPLEISSRSSRLSERLARVRSRGRIPPVRAASCRTVNSWQPTAGPIEWERSPLESRSQISRCCSAVSLFGLCTTPPFEDGNVPSREARCNHPLNPPADSRTPELAPRAACGKGRIRGASHRTHEPADYMERLGSRFASAVFAIESC